MQWVRRLSLAAPILCCLVASLPAVAGEETAEGFWEGTMSPRQIDMEIYVELSKEDSGSWTGAIDILAQGIHDYPLGEIVVDGRNVTFVMPGLAGKPTFVGELSEDGKSISGSFQQAGASFPFSLARRDEPRPDDSELFAAYEKPGVPGKGIEGLWLGILEAGVSRLRIDLRVTKGPDGNLVASMSSPDQESGEIPVDNMSYENGAFVLNASSISGTFKGHLAGEGAALVGEWTQGLFTFDMIFRRQAEEAASPDP